MSLFGKKILVTRPEHQARTLRTLFENAGAFVFLQPTIDILPPENWGEADQAIRNFDQFDFVIFASGNGVASFFERFARLRDTASCGCGNKKDVPDSNAFLSKKFIATGPGTAEQLAAHGVTSTVMPDAQNHQSFDAEGIIALLRNMGIEKKRFLLVRGDRGRDLLPTMLQAMGGIVKQISVYRSVDRSAPDFEIANLLRHGKIDWITVTSSAIAGSLVRMFQEELRHAKLVSISPITSATLSELGHPPTVEAAKATMQEIVNAVIDWENNQKKSL
ncbi:MAG: uroporphyrinogen-III synthase [Planctomycetaceae bacterium]|nr:uroporphyrinogen-III synthase [Planctomycetaceae bacterium]